MAAHFIHYITQKTASEIGVKLYFEGRKCVSGNYYLRRLSDRRCTCAECREIKAEKERARKANTPELHKFRVDYNREYRMKNKLLLNEKKKDYLKIKKQEGSPVYDKYLEKMSKSNKKMRQASPYLFKAYACAARVKAKYPHATPQDYGELDIFIAQQIYELKDMREKQTSIEWALDHMIPLAKGGMHKWDNFQLIPFKLNLFKKHRLAITKPYEWLVYVF